MKPVKTVTKIIKDKRNVEVGNNKLIEQFLYEIKLMINFTFY